MKLKLRFITAKKPRKKIQEVLIDIPESKIGLHTLKGMFQVHQFFESLESDTKVTLDLEE